MKFSLAWRNLVHSKARAAIAIIGTAFAIVLLFAQFGFYSAVTDTAVVNLQPLKFDAAIISPAYVHVLTPGSFPRRELDRAAALPGVASAHPFYVGYGLWRNPETRQRSRMLLMAFQPEDDVVDLPGFDAARELLKQPDKIVVDTMTRPEFGPIDVGTTTEVNGHHIEVVGQYTQGVGLGIFGGCFAGVRTFLAISPGSADDVAIGLLRVHPGADVEAVVASLRTVLGNDARVLTREELEAVQRNYWMVQSNIGLLFAAGVVLAFLVGAIVLYQLLAAEVLSRLPEFATLKAMGYRDSYLTRVVMETAAILSCLSYPPAVLLSLGIYKAIRHKAHLIIGMTGTRLVAVFLLVLLMGTIAGLLTIRRVKKADPAELF